MSVTVRECLNSYQEQSISVAKGRCIVRISDLDGYEHMVFMLKDDTDLDGFNNVFDQQMLDANVSELYADFVNDEEDYDFEITIVADIEL